jgi:hypothetical protein
MMHQFQPIAALGHLKMWPRASRLLANRNTFVDRAVHRDAARACTRARAGTALRARAEQQNRGSGGKKKFHDSVFRAKTEFDSSLAGQGDAKAASPHRKAETAPHRSTYQPPLPAGFS